MPTVDSVAHEMLIAVAAMAMAVVLVAGPAVVSMAAAVVIVVVVVGGEAVLEVVRPVIQGVGLRVPVRVPECACGERTVASGGGGQRW